MSRPEDDPEVRKKLLERSQAINHECFKISQNPLFALWTIGGYRTDEELPLWIRQWWLDVARKMLRASLYGPARPDRPEYNPTFEEAADKALKAFGMTKHGWNAVEEFHQVMDDEMLAECRFQLKIPVRTLARNLGVQPRQIYARTNRVKAKWQRVSLT